MESSVPYSQLSSPPPYSECEGRKAPHSYAHPGATVVATSSPAAAVPQQNVIVVASVATGAPNVVYNPYPVSMTTAIMLSCVVFWFFGMLFGAIAFVLAVMGNDSSTRGDILGALRLRNASYGVSVAGIVIFIVMITIIVVINKTQNHDY